MLKRLTGEWPTEAARSEDECEKAEGENDVLPGVERPLTGPEQRDRLGERCEVMDGPDVVCRGTAGTDEVACEMQMNGSHAPGERSEPAPRESEADGGEQESPGKAVEQNVVKAAVERWIAEAREDEWRYR